MKHLSEVNKCKMIMFLDYNSSKSSVDLSDKLSRYGTTLYHSLKGHQKVVIKFIHEIGMLNAHIVYYYMTRKKFSITEFYKLIIKELLTDRGESSLECVKHNCTN